MLLSPVCSPQAPRAGRGEWGGVTDIEPHPQAGIHSMSATRQALNNQQTGKVCIHFTDESTEGAQRL